jgi:hypothetical protein
MSQELKAEERAINAKLQTAKRTKDARLRDIEAAKKEIRE